jgi:hypothetical protein
VYLGRCHRFSRTHSRMRCSTCCQHQYIPRSPDKPDSGVRSAFGCISEYRIAFVAHVLAHHVQTILSNGAVANTTLALVDVSTASVDKLIAILALRAVSGYVDEAQSSSASRNLHVTLRKQPNRETLVVARA